MTLQLYPLFRNLYCCRGLSETGKLLAVKKLLGYCGHNFSPLYCQSKASLMENRLDKWNSSWKENRTSWHLDDVNFALTSYGSVFLPGAKHRVFVPLCGKTVDLKWLYDAGHSVVGLDGIEKACVEFFQEHGMKYVVEEFPKGKIYKSEDGRLVLYCCDLFAVDSSTLGKFDAIWDRGSLVAIYEEDRESYAKLMKTLLVDDFRYLLNIVQYVPTDDFSGPPRNISIELLKELFGDVCGVKVLETVDRTEENGVPNKFGLDKFEVVVVLLTPEN